MKITNIWFRAVGTYNKQYTRPYVVAPLTGNHILSLQEATQYGALLGQSNLASVSSDILQYSATPTSEVNIANGFDEPRFYFFIEAILGGSSNFSRKTAVISGYTSHQGITPSGVFDPNMVLYLNNHAILRETVTMTGRGNNVRTNLASNEQILVSNNNGSPAPISLFDSNGMMTDTRVLMRPREVFSNAAFTEAHVNPAHLLGESSGRIHDMRNVLVKNVNVSSRENNVSSNYLSRVLASQAAAEHNASNENSIYATAEGYVTETPATQLSGLQPIIMETDFLKRGWITWGELISLPDNLGIESSDAVVVAFPKPNEYIHRAGDTEYLHGTSPEVHIAVSIANSLPTILMRYMTMGISVTLTNDTLGGAPQTIVHNVQTLRNQDASVFMSHMIQDIQNTVLRAITNNYQNVATVNINCDVFHETTVDVSWEGSAVTRLTLPTFCDGVNAPVIGDAQPALDSLSTGLVSVLDAARNYNMHDASAYNSGLGF